MAGGAQGAAPREEAPTAAPPCVGNRAHRGRRRAADDGPRKRPRSSPAPVGGSSGCSRPPRTTLMPGTRGRNTTPARSPCERIRTAAIGAHRGSRCRWPVPLSASPRRQGCRPSGAPSGAPGATSGGGRAGRARRRARGSAPGRRCGRHARGRRAPVLCRAAPTVRLLRGGRQPPRAHRAPLSWRRRVEPVLMTPPPPPKQGPGHSGPFSWCSWHITRDLPAGSSAGTV